MDRSSADPERTRRRFIALMPRLLKCTTSEGKAVKERFVWVLKANGITTKRHCAKQAIGLLSARSASDYSAHMATGSDLSD